MLSWAMLSWAMLNGQGGAETKRSFQDCWHVTGDSTLPALSGSGRIEKGRAQREVRCGETSELRLSNHVRLARELREQHHPTVRHRCVKDRPGQIRTW